MSTNRRLMMALRGGNNIDWESIARGVIDCTTQCDIPAEAFGTATTVERYRFYSCTGITSVSLPDTITKIGSGVFWNCTGLTSITLSNTLTEIGESAFRSVHLTTINFPASLTTIKHYAFNQVTTLTEMIFEGTTPPTLSEGTYALGATNLTFPIYVPDASVAAYQAGTNWTNYASRVVGISTRT